jgi:hypothetical protein
MMPRKDLVVYLQWEPAGHNQVPMNGWQFHFSCGTGIPGLINDYIARFREGATILQPK